MQRLLFNSDRGPLGSLARRFGAILAMSSLLLLSACDGKGNTVDENNFEDNFGKDGIPPTLTSVTMKMSRDANPKPNGTAKEGQTIRIDIVASEALMRPTVFINDLEAEITGSVTKWTATREMTASDVDGMVYFSIGYTDISGEIGETVLATTDGSAVQYCAEGCPESGGSSLAGTWRLDGVGSAGVGPAENDVSWWSANDQTLIDRACWFDDEYVFGADGSFRNVQGDESWIEEFAGGPAGGGCGAPVAPHDGSNVGTWTYDEDASTLTISGQGLYLGLPKVVNGAELSAPSEAPASVTYDVAVLDGDILTVNIDYGGGWWQFRFAREPVSPVLGKWKLDGEGAAGVGPAENDTSWWSAGAQALIDRACWFDDVYEFNADGSFRNVQGDESWIEEFAGGPAGGGCGAPVAPHDGSNNAIYEYDEDANTLKVTGVGAYIGLPKVANGVELTAPSQAPESVTYDVEVLDGDVMTLNIDYGGGWWQFRLKRVSNSPLIGNWKLDGEGAAGVGPAENDTSWWSAGAQALVDRACWFDDVYHFGDDGSFQNFQEDESWIEEFAGGPAGGGCGAPVAPHDGSTVGTFDYDAVANTLTVNGVGAYIGLPKVANGVELAAPSEAPDSVTYDVEVLDGDLMTLNIDYGGGWWQFRLARVPEATAVAGKWKLDGEGAAGVGPTENDTSWWSAGAQALIDRACWFDDVYEFDADGSFQIVQDDESWIEEFAGGVAGGGCGAPVAPHDGSNTAIYEYDEGTTSLKLTGVGAYIGLPKVANGVELAAPSEAPESVTYDVEVLDGDSMTVNIDYGGGWWQFRLARVSNSPLIGNWKLDGEGAAGVGPTEGDTSWWSAGAQALIDRACWFDDVYHFGDDGSFQNFQEDESWIEEFAGGPAGGGCGAPVAPHDGSNAATFSYDATANTITVTGVGAYLGLPKVANGVELTAPSQAPDSVTYTVATFDAGIVTVNIDYGGGWWQFRLAKQ